MIVHTDKQSINGHRWQADGKVWMACFFLHSECDTFMCSVTPCSRAGKGNYLLFSTEPKPIRKHLQPKCWQTKYQSEVYSSVQMGTIIDHFQIDTQ
jgi:hypothetical protein